MFRDRRNFFSSAVLVAFVALVSLGSVDALTVTMSNVPSSFVSGVDVPMAVVLQLVGKEDLPLAFVDLVVTKPVGSEVVCRINPNGQLASAPLCPYDLNGVSVSLQNVAVTNVPNLGNVYTPAILNGATDPTDGAGAAESEVAEIVGTVTFAATWDTDGLDDGTYKVRAVVYHYVQQSTVAAELEAGGGDDGSDGAVPPTPTAETVAESFVAVALVSSSQQSFAVSDPPAPSPGPSGGNTGGAGGGSSGFNFIRKGAPATPAAPATTPTPRPAPTTPTPSGPETTPPTPELTPPAPTAEPVGGIGAAIANFFNPAKSPLGFAGGVIVLVVVVGGFLYVKVFKKKPGEGA